jgi:hypothetical protein
LDRKIVEADGTAVDFLKAIRGHLLSLEGDVGIGLEVGVAARTLLPELDKRDFPELTEEPAEIMLCRRGMQVTHM